MSPKEKRANKYDEIINKVKEIHHPTEYKYTIEAQDNGISGNVKNTDRTSHFFVNITNKQCHGDTTDMSIRLIKKIDNTYNDMVKYNYSTPKTCADTLDSRDKICDNRKIIISKICEIAEENGYSIDIKSSTKKTTNMTITVGNSSYETKKDFSLKIPGNIENTNESITHIMEQIKCYYNACINDIKHKIAQEHKEALQKLIGTVKVCGLPVKWEGDKVKIKGNMHAPDDGLLMPIDSLSYDKKSRTMIGLSDTYLIDASNYFADKIESVKFTKKSKVPKACVDYVNEFSSLQSPIFSNSEPFKAQAIYELIPLEGKTYCYCGKLKFDMEGNELNENKEYDAYLKDTKKWARQFKCINNAISSSMCNIKYLDGPGLYFGDTKLEFSFFNKKKCVVIKHGDTSSMTSQIKSESKKLFSECINENDKKIDDDTKLAVALLISLNSGCSHHQIIANLRGLKYASLVYMKDTIHTGTMRSTKEEEIDNAIDNLKKYELVRTWQGEGKNFSYKAYGPNKDSDIIIQEIAKRRGININS